MHHLCVLLEICLPSPARKQDTCRPYGLNLKLWDLQLDKKFNGPGHCFSVCAVSHSSRYKPDAGLSDFREAVAFATIFRDQVMIRDGCFLGGVTDV